MTTFILAEAANQHDHRDGSGGERDAVPAQSAPRWAIVRGSDAVSVWSRAEAEIPQVRSFTPVRFNARQRSSGERYGSSTLPPIVHEVLGSPGRLRNPATRAFVEPRLGHDFGRVRVHADASVGASARAVGAQADTVGRNVVFAPRHCAPGTARELDDDPGEGRVSAAVPAMTKGSLA